MERNRKIKNSAFIIKQRCSYLFKMLVRAIVWRDGAREKILEKNYRRQSTVDCGAEPYNRTYIFDIL